MARPRNVEAPSLSPGQAAYVLDRLIAERRLSSSELTRYVNEMHREIVDLEERLRSLRAASGSTSSTAVAAQPARRRGRPPRAKSAQAGVGAPAARRGSGRPTNVSSGKAAGRRRRSPAPLSPEQLASRQLQGRYLALIRQIPATRRAQYSRMAKEKGRESAIREMQDAIRK